MDLWKKTLEKFRHVVGTLRNDGWENAVTGLGVRGQDKATATHFYPGCYLSLPLLASLFNHEPFARRIVATRPKEMFREGYDLKHPDATDLLELAKPIRVDEKLKWGRIWGNLFGGCLGVLGIDDGQEMDQPLNEEGMRSFTFINLIDRRFAHVWKRYDDPSKPKFTEPEVYMITDISGHGISFIHETRLLRWDGAKCDQMTEWSLNGWSLSVLQCPWDILRKFNGSYDAAGHLLQDASQGVWKLKGLMDAVASEDEDGSLAARMQMADMGRSVAHAVLLDADGGEEFDRVATSFAGIADILGAQQQYLAAGVDMPVTLLMGRSPAGQNATGDSDFRHWYDGIAADQKAELGPELVRVYSLLARVNGKDPKDMAVEFRPLWAPTMLEMAQIRQLSAQADTADITSGVLFPEEVALSRYRPEGYSTETTLHDPEAREEAMAHRVEFSVDQAAAQKDAGPVTVQDQAALKAGPAKDPKANEK